MCAENFTSRNTNIEFSYEQAVSLFKSCGFLVEPGPEPGEVSLTIPAPYQRKSSVYPADMLPEIAAAFHEIRSRTLARVLLA